MKWKYLFDVVFSFEDETVSVEKNRYGMIGQFKIN
jgi:hypothetical protein